MQSVGALFTLVRAQNSAFHHMRARVTLSGAIMLMCAAFEVRRKRFRLLLR